jgi:hypothetical protein
MNWNRSSKYSPLGQPGKVSDDVAERRPPTVVPTSSGKRLLYSITPLLLAATSAVGATPDMMSTPATTWHAQTLGQALLNMLLFAGTGIAAAIIGYKLFDYCTPGDLSKEIIQNKNVAAAIVAAAVILGVCVIVAIAMLG